MFKNNFKKKFKKRKDGGLGSSKHGDIVDREYMENIYK